MSKNNIEDKSILGYETIFQKIIGYKFKNQGFIKKLMNSGTLTMERYEFMGDSILNFLCKDYIFNNLPSWAGPNDLTQIYDSYSCNKFFENLGIELGLDKIVFISNNKVIQGKSIADIIESIFGAVYLDGGLVSAKRVFNKIIKPKIVLPEIENPDLNPWKKLKLYYTEKGNSFSPIINEVDTLKNNIKVISCYIRGLGIEEGTGSNIEECKKDVARKFLLKIKENEHKTE